MGCDWSAIREWCRAVPFEVRLASGVVKGHLALCLAFVLEPDRHRLHFPKIHELALAGRVTEANDGAGTYMPVA